MAPRSTGNAVILLGLERVPVRVFPAVIDPPRVSFATLCKAHGSKVEQLHRCPVDEKVIDKESKADSLVKGYEMGKGNFLVLTDEELLEVQPESDPEIVIEGIIEVELIDPIFWGGKPQYLGADVGTGPVVDLRAQRAFASFVEALQEASEGESTVAIGRWSVRGTDKLVGIRPKDRRLVVQELRRAGEVRDIGELEAAVVADPKTLDVLDPIVKRLRLDAFDPAAYPDEKYSETVKLLQAKAEKAAKRPGPHRAERDGPKVRPKRASK